jgi:WD40 repeat protein
MGIEEITQSGTPPLTPPVLIEEKPLYIAKLAYSRGNRKIQRATPDRPDLQGWIDVVAVAPDSSWVATTGLDGTARAWDPATGLQRTAFTGHTGTVGTVAVAPDGSWLATGSYDGTARIWDSATGHQCSVFSRAR